MNLSSILHRLLLKSVTFRVNFIQESLLFHFDRFIARSALIFLLISLINFSLFALILLNSSNVNIAFTILLIPLIWSLCYFIEIFITCSVYLLFYSFAQSIALAVYQNYQILSLKLLSIFPCSKKLYINPIAPLPLQITAYLHPKFLSEPFFS